DSGHEAVVGIEKQMTCPPAWFFAGSSAAHVCESHETVEIGDRNGLTRRAWKKQMEERALVQAIASHPELAWANGILLPHAPVEGRPSLRWLDRSPQPSCRERLVSTVRVLRSGNGLCRLADFPGWFLETID